MQVVGRTLAEMLLADEISIEAAHRGDGASHRAWRETAGDLTADKRFERGAIERLEPGARGRGETGERAQVARVTVEGVRRETALDPQMIEVGFYQRDCATIRRFHPEASR